MASVSCDVGIGDSFRLPDGVEPGFVARDLAAVRALLRAGGGQVLG